jgi:hypothetical protein
MVKVGQKVRFDPFYGMKGYGVEVCREEVTGTVVMINHKHKWFLVAYGNNRTSFRFDDIGELVTIVG